MSTGRMDYSSAIRDVAPPQLKQLKQTVTLSKAARLRLSWLDYYNTHGTNAALTARHFGIAKSQTPTVTSPLASQVLLTMPWLVGLRLVSSRRTAYYLPITSSIIS
jgi:hypothetical protein